ncbi:conserved hypothetical protein, steroid delta-isomerase-related [Chitinophaga ginsengisegetis]|uniref:SnoaL-like polyketide cyclase n=1 Tax=Chitinophaga ginsengisegetis TaxID=393003 RepID=A0A1T5PAQ7_9BACT|nr:ester cyclase [Chitinophaga ginsengisegetis]SKD09791.1 conserved hypothetical protein, steroid delta-isomerase-related [Chitinophaga ginsengisegetis]
MAREEKIQLMNRFVEFINTANPQLADELISPDAVFHVPGNPEPMRGPEGYLAIIGMMRSGFPDIQWSPDDVVIDNDRVAVRFTMKGTHKNIFFGIAATERSIEIKAMNFYYFKEGQIIEEHGMPDMFGLLLQLGAVINAG